MILAAIRISISTSSLEENKSQSFCLSYYKAALWDTGSREGRPSSDTKPKCTFNMDIQLPEM